MVQSEQNVYTEYADPKRSEWITKIQLVLKKVPLRVLVKACGEHYGIILRVCERAGASPLLKGSGDCQGRRTSGLQHGRNDRDAQFRDERGETAQSDYLPFTSIISAVRTEGLSFATANVVLAAT